MKAQTPMRASSPGTRPAGARDESEAARQVREMFSRIAPRYDFLNHLLSLELDRMWRRRVARRFRHILKRADARALDLCCGTGDLAFALARAGEEAARKQGGTEAGSEAGSARESKRGSHARVFGSDFAHPMLVRAVAKGGRGALRVAFTEADALELPFAGASFDLVAAAFGFRNLANYERGLAEIFRVLRPGGEATILEFCEPRGRLFGRLYRFYFTRVVPRLGGVISGSAMAYSYLPSSVQKFPSPEELAELMGRAGLAEARFELWSRGIVALHTARRE